MAWHTTYLAIALSLCAALPAQAQPTPSDTSVKAGHLYKLAPFVEWPASDPSRPFTLCIIGPDPFGAELDSAVAGQAYDGRPFTVTRLATLEAPEACDIAYAGGSAEQVAATLRAAQGHPVLTVTDNSATPGMVDFTIDQDKVRFRIDQTAAEASGLTVSSKLLSLALSVRSARVQP